MAIHQEIVFTATSPQRVYEAFMDSSQHAEFTSNGDVEISRDEGGAFSCHGGVIAGRNIELVPNARIVQAWRVASWGDGIYSVLRIELTADGDDTRLVMDHSGVPEDQVGHIGEGWHARYWTPLRAFLEA